MDPSEDENVLHQDASSSQEPSSSQRPSVHSPEEQPPQFSARVSDADTRDKDEQEQEPEQTQISRRTLRAEQEASRLSVKKSLMARLSVEPSGVKEGPSLITTQADISRENISKQLLQLMEEDANEFTEMDIKEIMPTSPFSDTSYSKLKEFYETILSDLSTANKVGIPMDEIKEEFHFLWNGISKCHNNLNDLLKKDVELTVEVADTMAKTRNLIRIAEDHPEITARLGSRLETAWNLVDVSEEEERRNAARIEELKTDIMILNRNIQAAANMEGQSELTELMKIRKKLQDERDVLNKEMGRMRTSLALFQERKARLGEKKVEFQEAIRYCDEEAAAQNEALRRETQRKESIESEIEGLTVAIEKKTKELNDIEKYSSGAKGKLAELERSLTAQKIINEIALKEAEAVFQKLEKLKHDFEIQVDHVEKLALETFKKQNDLKEKENEIVKIKAEGMQAVRQRNMNLKRCGILQERLDILETDRDSLKQRIVELERELEAAQKKLEENKRRVEELDKKRTTVNRNLTKASQVASDHENQLRVHLVASNNLERELEAYKREIVTQTETIHRLERERDYYSHEGTKLAHEFALRLEEVKKMDMIVFDFRKRVGEMEGTVKTKHQEYEQSLVERRFFEKLLRDTGTSILEAQREVRHKTFELNMAIYSYYDQQTKFGKQKAFLEHLLREGSFFKTEADRIRKMAIDMQREVEALESERSLLGTGVAEAENELSKQRYYATMAESRRQNYNRRLQQTEAELRKEWETWRTLHSMVRIGAYHYRILLSEIREIQQNITNLRRVQHKFKGNNNHIVLLQQEISVLENCIAKETCMVNALEDELTRPINVHRWRALEAIDPDAYDAIKKINIVTKRLVDQNENIRKQTLRIADKERIYVDLRHVIRRLPSIETPESRQYYEVLLGAKKAQLKKIKMDLYTIESQKKYYNHEVEKMQKRMNELKQLYFDKMRGGSATSSKAKRVPSITSGLKEKQAARSLTDASVRLSLKHFSDYKSRSEASLREIESKNEDGELDLEQLKTLYTKFQVEDEELEKEIEEKKSILAEEREKSQKSTHSRSSHKKKSLLAEQSEKSQKTEYSRSSQQKKSILSEKKEKSQSSASALSSSTHKT